MRMTNDECPMTNGGSPIDTARALYEKHGLDFKKDFDEHRTNGVVVALPTCFVMGKAVELPDGRIAWFIQAAVGNIRQLIRLFPWPLPFIAFCRKPGGRVRVYPIERFKSLIRHSSFVIRHSAAASTR